MTVQEPIEEAVELTVDALAQEIRRVDGNHDLGAGALAEALLPFIRRASPPVPAGDGLEEAVKLIAIRLSGDLTTTPQATAEILSLIYAREALLRSALARIAGMSGWTERDGGSSLSDAIDAAEQALRPTPAGDEVSSSARNEGEAVAWRYQFVTTTDGMEWSDWYYVDSPTDIPQTTRMVAQPLFTHPIQGEAEMREKVAAIIDPWAFSIVGNIMHTERAKDDREAAFKKADAILASLKSGGE